MVNDINIISKITKGLKIKINKKKKNNWKTLKSNDNLPNSTEDEYMLYSDTEYELYHAKANVEANRSFNFNNNLSNDENNITFNTGNTSTIVGRSKTVMNHRTVTERPLQTKNLYTQSFKTENRKSDVTSHPLLKNKHSSSYIVSKTTNTLSISPTTYASAPTSPIAPDTNHTDFIDMNSNNPFINLKPKEVSTTTTTTTNTDPALQNTLIEPIEFDHDGKKIDKPTTTTTSSASSTVTFAPQQPLTTLKQNTTSTTTTPEQLLRYKSIKRIKPLITFDTPPVVSPITTETDSEEYVHGRKRSNKKHKKYSKKRSSLLTLKTTSLAVTKKEKMYTSPTSAIVARANSRLHSPDGYTNDEDDDVPLGIIQYKCISSLLKDVGPTTISSLQYNTTKKSHKSKSNYGFLTPPGDAYYEKYDYPKFNHYSSYYQENYVI